VLAAAGQPRTHQLIALLSDDLAAAVLASLRAAPATEGELGVALGASQPAVNRCVNALAAFALVERTQPITMATSTPFRPSSWLDLT
jgi:hypothetical protein